MAFYKKVKQKGDDKWHPRAVTKGHPYTTDEIARLLSEMSTVTPGDTYAVLMNLGEVLGKLMSSGHSVKLKGIGTFYYTCRPGLPAVSFGGVPVYRSPDGLRVGPAAAGHEPCKAIPRKERG